MTRLVEPEILSEATELLRQGGERAKAIGGGTAVVLLMQQGLLRPEVLVSLRRLADVDGWAAIKDSTGMIQIGGGVTLAELASSPAIRRSLPSLSRATGLVGNVRVRNAATVGGALAEADYAADLPAVLVNLGAEVVVSNGRAERLVPSAEFFVDYFTTALEEDELVTHIRLPEPREGTVTSYIKFSSRSLEDRPCVVVAASGLAIDDELTGDGLDVVVGAIGPTPFRCTEALEPVGTETLADSAIDAIAREYASSCTPLDDLRGSPWYRREMVDVLVARAVRALRLGWCGRFP